MSEQAFKPANPARPGRLLAEQAAPVLGFKKHEIPILVRAKLLKPLANPPRNAVKYFATAEIEGYARDADWLCRATKAVYRYWADQNRKRRIQTHSVEA
jgi:hypothetical protein